MSSPRSITSPSAGVIVRDVDSHARWSPSMLPLISIRPRGASTSSNRPLASVQLRGSLSGQLAMVSCADLGRGRNRRVAIVEQRRGDQQQRDGEGMRRPMACPC
jgi:hypothetical protein